MESQTGATIVAIDVTVRNCQDHPRLLSMSPIEAMRERSKFQIITMLILPCSVALRKPYVD